MARLRTAIVGAGLMGGWHARYAARAGAEIAAVVDPRAEAAASVRRRFPGAEAFTDLAECLSSRALDVVHVCTSRESHAALVAMALAAGKHALVEKPAATSAAEAQRLADLARQQRLKLCPVHQLPFQQGVLRVRRDRARLGDLVRVSHVVASAGGEGLPEDGRRALLLDMLPHSLSLFRAFVGAGLDAVDWSVLAATPDDLEVVGTRAGTRLAVVLSLRARPTRNELLVAGTAAAACADLFHGFATSETGEVSRRSKALAPFRRGGGLLAQAAANLLRRTARWEPAYPGLLELIRAFYASLRDGGESPVSLDELVETATAVECMAALARNSRADDRRVSL